ncbi:MAG: MFS transporter, partial [Candidatus Sericytochromatia bacterium]
ARHFTARHMNWLHACWGVGATLGTATAATVVVSGLAWQSTYGLLGLVMVVMTLVFTLSLKQWRDGPATGSAHQAEAPATMREALGQPLVWAQIGVFFAYTGVEMTVGQWSYTLLTQYRDYSLEAAGMAVSVYWGALTAGRFLLGAIVHRLGVPRLLRMGATTALLGGLTFVVAPWAWLSAVGLAVVGFSLAPIYPGLMTQTPSRLGRFSDFAVGFQASAGMLGAVLVPTVGGLILQTQGAAWLNGMIGGLVVVLWLSIMALFRARTA